MFGPVVAKISLAGSPVELELFLCFAVPEPIETHVHGFSSSWLDVLIYDSEGGAVVRLHRGWWLWVAHFV